MLGVEHLVEKLEIYVQCKNLKNLDYLSKSDPQALFFMQDIKTKVWGFIGKTEKIDDNLNPVFVKTIQIDYIFETQQNLRIQVIDVDDGKQDSKDYDIIGECYTSVGQLFGAIEQTSQLNLMKGSKNHGQIILKVDKKQEVSQIAEMQISGRELQNIRMFFFNKINPFLRFYKNKQGSDNQQLLLVHQTEPCNKTRSPKWKRFSISLEKLCNNDVNEPIVVELWDHRSSGDHNIISKTTITLNQLLNDKQIILQNKNILKLDFLQVQKKYNLSDYIRNGLQLGLICSIDFTGSNGHPQDPRSLHYINPNQFNQYQFAIYQVGQILINYDHDRIVPSYGFGGVCPGQSKANHCFSLTGGDPNCYEVQGILNAYQQAIQVVKLSGPTLFTPTINQCIQYCQQLKNNNANQYQILLIITDGAICDMPAAKQAIVSASLLPMSIIIIGVGDADFSSMEELDGDNGLVDAQGRVAKRDLVQFVPMNQFKNSPEYMLASEVLKELPDQVVEYYKMTGVQQNQQY